MAWPPVRCLAESCFSSYPRCVSLTSEVMCMLWLVLCVRLLMRTAIWPHPRSLPPRRARLRPPRVPDCQLSERSPGINRSDAAGEQNNKQPRASRLVPSPDICVVCGCPMRSRGTPGCFAPTKNIFCFNSKRISWLWTRCRRGTTDAVWSLLSLAKSMDRK